MNAKRRETLRKAASRLAEAGTFVAKALDEEEDCFDNLPESFAEGERGEKMENTIGLLSDASDAIESAMQAIDEAIR